MVWDIVSNAVSSDMVSVPVFLIPNSDDRLRLSISGQVFGAITSIYSSLFLPIILGISEPICKVFYCSEVLALKFTIIFPYNFNTIQI